MTSTYLLEISLAIETSKVGVMNDVSTDFTYLFVFYLLSAMSGCFGMWRLLFSSIYLLELFVDCLVVCGRDHFWL